ncbi:L-aspartate oxidase [Bacillus sp. FJAT-49736]|uniref:L-aspartate oxidase n=1 Tax=Bacillus sp. FJAT-49736 TaxID=2833582 RepID=UPI001BC953E8|nr:L-aspartate oxidase [Bacillus sp. FJAT-49736]MBS4173683.1 L-aspartate oxidase [Bacillus sp. FJAT-49736]
MEKIDILIVGSGIAALQLAHHLSKQFHVMIITKSTKWNSNSYLAQGGVAAALSYDDHFQLHYKDTLEAGCYFHNNREVLQLVKSAPELIFELQQSGFTFDMNEKGEVCLGKEGAHSRKRIVHSGGDATGKNLMDYFFMNMPSNVKITENEFVYEIILDPQSNRCIGVKTKTPENQIRRYYSRHVVLAVGGVGGLYPYSSNASSITGDGIALAFNAGAEIADMEFIQFHPTLLYVNGKTYGLISEAVRGEGAILMNDSNEKIMEGIHPSLDLAPRHVVAEQIFMQLQSGKKVYLDITMIEHFKEKFPTITALCEKNGVSIAEGKIPVAPGCHFLMGGIVIDSLARTTVEGLYAVGETACSGVHGANRLASNSLLEGLYFGRKLANYFNNLTDSVTKISYPVENPITEQQSIKLPAKEEIQEKMMECAGIMRTGDKLLEFYQWLEQYETNLIHFNELSMKETEIIFMLITAKTIVKSALLRKESRGGHIRKDFPNKEESMQEQHIIQTMNQIFIRRYQNEYHQIAVHA